MSSDHGANKDAHRKGTSVVQNASLAQESF